MIVLIACEESQAVCKAFRKKGHIAFSCDIEDCSGGHPEWHIKQDVTSLLNGKCNFKTCDGLEWFLPDKWDMIIAFPPCTHLANSGARHFENKRNDGRQREGIEFFCQFLNADCEKVVIENPVGIISGSYIKKWFPDLCQKYDLPKKPTQKIQPFEFGHPFIKTTCLWLKGVKPLKSTDILVKPDKGWVNQSFTSSGRYGGFNGLFNDPKIRSKTFEGIAEAMADQWGAQ